MATGGRWSLGWVIGAGLLAWSGSAHAYRPFISTDAAVADPKEMEIELGYITVERAKHENTFTTPALVLNYGLLERWELVGEFRIQEGPGAEVTDPAVFLKAVVKEGVLQDKEGVSLAVEAGPLLPSTVRGERGVGFEGTGILSVRIAPFTAHVNAGGGVDRANGRPFATWGVIGELPLTPRIRVVSEVSGEATKGQRAGSSALVGFIWQPSASNIYLDAAVRRGMSGGASDWTFTAGVTFGFKVFPFSRSGPGS